MTDNKQLQIKLLPYEDVAFKNEFDLDKIIFGLNSQIDLLSSQADKYDYLLSIASGIFCSMLDILWVGEFNLKRGRDIADNKIDDFVKKIAKMHGCKGDDLQSAIEYLENKFHIPSDGNTPNFGGGLQHHLRDFAHHPTIVGLMFSLLTQFTFKSYGTDVNGCFMVVDVAETSKIFIGKDIPTKILFGTLYWFFHLVSDMAGTSTSAGKGGGVGIPGPILALAKELSVLPFFKNLNINDNSLSKFLSKLFNGTLFAKRDENGLLIKESVLKFDLRGELGFLIELGRQALPLIANECLVRSFYFVRHFAIEVQANNITSFSDIKNIEWSKIMPANNPTIARMLTISTGVFTTLDIGEAVVSQKYWVSVNYVGIGRFAIAIGEDVSWSLKARNIKNIKKMYEDIKRFAFLQSDKKIYERIGDDMGLEKFCLTVDQTEILYNLEYFKTMNDIQNNKLLINYEGVKNLKLDWLNEWKNIISSGFESFLQVKGAKINWYNDEKELIQKIEENEPHKTWFRLVLLEAMLFEPYYTLGLEKDKKGNNVPSQKYKMLQNIFNGFKKDLGDNYLDSLFCSDYYTKGYIARLRKCHNSVLFELNEVLKALLRSITITAIITLVIVATAGILAPKIAIALVGSKFIGLNGAALASACLAYLGGGAIAIGGAGMAGGMAVIVGGGAILGLGGGAVLGLGAGASALVGQKYTIIQSAKLLVSVREIFLNDEHDLEYSNSVYEKYVQNLIDIEKGLVELRFKVDEANEKEKKELLDKIKKTEESVRVMKIAKNNLLKFKSSFEEGLKNS
ncbi:MAG: hypothetical protein GYA87_07625 [Christensenellaceae bacterium]|nr:hypothetical protein [Christensenellaceae bacterium]